MISIYYNPNAESADPVGGLTAEGGAGGDYTFALSDFNEGGAEGMAALLNSYGVRLEPDGKITGTVVEGTGDEGVLIYIDVTDGNGNMMTSSVTITLNSIIN